MWLTGWYAVAHDLSASRSPACSTRLGDRGKVRREGTAQSGAKSELKLIDDRLCLAARVRGRVCVTAQRGDACWRAQHVAELERARIPNQGLGRFDQSPSVGDPT